MPYCTQTDLVDRYGQALIVALTDRGATATGTIDSDVVDRAIGDAGNLIDGYVGKRYALPVTPAQPLLATLALQIAVYVLHVSAPDPKIVEDYKEALRQLQAISNGTLVLTAAGVEAAGTGGSGARITDRARPFTEDNLKGFI